MKGRPESIDNFSGLNLSRKNFITKQTSIKGSIHEKYKLIRKLDEGANGIVYHALDR